MSKIAIIGASGHVGSQLVKEALRRGHTVTALARNVDSIAPQAQLRMLAVDVQDPAATEQALKGHDVVLSSARFASIAAGPLIESVKKAGVKRLLVVGGAATLLLPSGERLLDSPNFPAIYLTEASAGAAWLQALRQAQDLDWTFLSPSAEFVDGPRTEHFRLGTDHLLTDAAGRSWISFADFAIAMLDEVENAAHRQQRFTVGY
jgi:putative NADH-flavin reductase